MFEERLRDLNIIALFIRTLPEKLNDFMNKLIAVPQCEVYFYDTEGRVIVILESKNMTEQKEKITLIESFPEILYTEVHFVYSESEFINFQENIEVLAKNLH